MFDSNYNMNSWDAPEGRYGQGHLQGLDPETGGQPVFREAFDAVTPGYAARLKTLDEQFAREHGFTVSKFIQLARETVASEGIAGLDRLVRSGAIPKAVAAALPSSG